MSAAARLAGVVGAPGAPDAPAAPAAGGLDFLTVLVFSCEASCDGDGGGGGLREEHVFVVPDGDARDDLVRLR